MTRWGRVGASGQKKIDEFSTLISAKTAFEKKFKDKTGNKWNSGEFKAHSGKYVLLERDYGLDSENKDDEIIEDDEDNSMNAKIVCTLNTQVQELVDMVFDPNSMVSVLKTFNLDLNKAPLGKLKSKTLLQGLEKLKELEAALKSNTKNKSQLTQLSSEYYSLIPHSFGKSNF